MTTDPPSPRRKWHFNRWLIVFIVATLGWGGWRAYAFRAALSQARALGWEVKYTGPAEEIRQNWRAAFEKETWMDGVTWVVILTGESFERHLAIVHLLNPKRLQVYKATTLRDLSVFKSLARLRTLQLELCTGLTNVDALKDLSGLQYVLLERCVGLTNVDALKNLSALQYVSLDGCTGLTNVDALKNLSALQFVSLDGCTGLTNVDGLKNLSALKKVVLTGCTGLTKESVAALKAALPNAEISGP